MTNAERTLIINLWESGHSIEYIAQMLSYPTYKAKQMVRDMRKDGTLKERNVTEIALARLTAAYNNGITDPRELARLFGYSLNTTTHYLRLAGIKRGHPPKQYFPKPLGEKTLAIIRDLESSKMTLSEIAKKHGVSRQYVYQLKERIEE